MKKNIVKALQFAVFLGLGVLLVWWGVSGTTAQDRAEILDAFKNASYGWLLLSMILAVCSHFSRAVRWKMMLDPISENKTRVRTAFSALMAGYLGNLAFPRLGEVMRCGILSRYDKISIDKIVGTVITERIIDVIILLSLTIIVVLFQLDLLGDYFYTQIYAPKKEKYAALLSSPLLLIGGLLFLGILTWGAWRLLRNFKQTLFYEKIKGVLQNLWIGIQSVKDVESIPAFIGHTVFIWSMYFCMIYICFFSVEGIDALGVRAGWAVLVFGSFAMVATQGGLGAYPLIVAGVLGLYGVAYNLGYAFGWIAWTTQTVMVLIVGVLALANLAWMRREEEIGE